ncbi:MAG: hypothetical protein LUI60_02125 [Clostridia bacterium]|nr:hypothetical protein [Clostridia bacterium]
MSEVKLFKKKGTYVDKEGKEKAYTNFYVRCGDDTLVPVQVCYFEDKDGRDPQYSARRAVLSAFAETLPDKADKEDKPASPTTEPAAKPAPQPLNDEETRIPF